MNTKKNVGTGARPMGHPCGGQSPPTQAVGTQHRTAASDAEAADSTPLGTGASPMWHPCGGQSPPTQAVGTQLRETISQAIWFPQLASGASLRRDRKTENPFLRKEFPATLKTSRSSLPLLARCGIRRGADRLVSSGHHHIFSRLFSWICFSRFVSKCFRHF